MVDWEKANVTPAYLAAPENGAQGPGVIVLHAWWGLNDFFKEVCNRLAAEGFVAAAPDLYDGAVAATVEEAQQLATNLDFESALIKAVGVSEFLKIHPAVKGKGQGVLGFSMGGAWALLLSTVEPEDVAAVVTFYGTNESDFATAKAAYLGHFAPLDPWEPEKDVQKLEDSLHLAGRDVTFYTYPGVNHWFFEENNNAYNPEAAGLAWERTIEFLKRQLMVEP